MDFLDTWVLVHDARLDDLLKLCELRNYTLTLKHTKLILYFSLYLQDVLRPNSLEVNKQAMFKLANKLNIKLTPSQLNGVLGYARRRSVEYNSYVEGFKLGVCEELRRGEKKPGLNFKNKTLIEELEITEFEQKKLKTIISPKEKYERLPLEKKRDRNKKRDLQRKKERENKKRMRLDLIRFYLRANKTTKEIAMELKVSTRQVYRYKKELKR